MKKDTIIIGSGPAGLGASYALRKKGIHTVILEKDDTYGGLLGNFTTFSGFRFDRFVHFSFSDNKTVNELFQKSTGGRIIRHTPNPYNLYKGIWIKHPAQNNLFPLDEEEKEIIIRDFKNRPVVAENALFKNYEEWLRTQYGNAFAERFPLQYTRKYWMCEAKDLETRWVGNRLYQPSLKEVVEGSCTSETPVTYYAKEMRYPEHGGFRQFISDLAKDADIRFGCEVIEINPSVRTVKDSNGSVYAYSRVMSSMPLPLLIKRIKADVPENVRKAAERLKCTCGYIISIALRGKNIPPYLWWYIYDSEILPARIYSPSLKSPDNVPEGCSSLQLEVYCHENEYSHNELIEKSVTPLIRQKIIREEDIINVDVRFEQWANVIFDHNIYENRKIVLEYVRSLGIEPIGRFGLWDYLWSDQALLSGINCEKG